MNCIYCGNPLPEGAEACEVCKKAVKPKKQRKLKNRKVCAVLGFIFGILGLLSFPFIIDAALAVILSALGISSDKAKIAKAGLIMGIISLLAAFVLYIVFLAVGGPEAIAGAVYNSFIGFLK